ncbi:MAG: mechanosensitive ion channel family protein [Bacillota bacterium]
MTLMEIWQQYQTNLQPATWVRTLLTIVPLIVGFHLLIRIASAAIDRGVDITERRIRREEETRRAETIRGLLKSLVRYVVDFFAITTVLPLLGIPAAQLLAGAGIVGLAVGFGAQNLVRDVIAGFFFLYENQFTVGDFVETEGVTGVVEDMGLRVTKLRNFAGQIHILPNGSIGIVTNYSRGTMRVLVDVDVAYEEEIDEVLARLEELCGEMAEEIPDIVDGPRVLGLQSMNESSVTLRLIARAANMQQWGVERTMRHMIKRRFAELGIEIPYPRRVAVPPTCTKILGGREEEEDSQ